MKQISINLLPKKQRRQRLQLWVVGPLAAFLVISTVFITVLHYTKSQELNRTESAYSQVVQEREILEQQQTANAGTGSVEQLEMAIEFMKTYPIDTVPILDHFTERLPERGFFQSFQYNESGIIVLSVQFDSSREAAFYLSELQQSEWVANAAVSSITTSEIQSIETTDASDDEGAVLPRYVAQYTIELSETIGMEEETDE
ncbi:PilN domain-containing protein [Jeotgalibacillus proteolyticus]|uniref:PilN domain-containing protein n=1 Tax=Jeotgalibacillus proteolyticus TaxID=2082395 RepID=UPI003CEB3F10